MAAPAVASNNNNLSHNSGPTSTAAFAIGAKREKASISSVLSYRDKVNELFTVFEKDFVENPDRTDIIRRRMGLASRLTALLGDYSRDTRSMLLDGLALDFDFPLYIFDQMGDLMTKVAKSSSERLSLSLSSLAAAAAESATIANKQNKSADERITIATDLLQNINKVHFELKRLIAEFGSFFQPLCTIPAGFFNLPRINIQEKYLAAVATHWTSTLDAVKKVIFAATDIERSVFPQQDAGENPAAIKLRKSIADAIVFWCRIQNDGAARLDSNFIPDYLKDCEQALSRIGSKLSVKELLDVTVIRIDNECDRFRQIFTRDPTPVRRVVQLGLVKSQVDRISMDAEVGLNAAMAQLPYAELFHKLVLMLDFEDKCIEAICQAITRNVGSELGMYLARSETDEDRQGIIDVVASVYEKYRAAIASCKTNEQYRLRFYVAIRQGVNSGMGHAGMETTLAQHFHKLLKDSGSLAPAEVQFLAFDLRAAVATFGPLLRDVDVFVRIYKHRLGSRLMTRKSPNAKLENFVIDELTGSIGPAYTHGMKAMVDQYQYSTTSNNNNKKSSSSTSSLQPSSSSVPVSKYVWPSFSMLSQSTIVLHPVVVEMMNKEVNDFSNKNPDLKASSHPLLSSVELRTGNNAGIFGNSVQCSMLMFIAAAEKSSGMTAQEIADKMKMTEKEAQWIGGTLVQSRVVEFNSSSSKYMMLPIEGGKRIVLSSVWGTASRSAAVGAKAFVSSPSKQSNNKNNNQNDDFDEENASSAADCVVQ